MRRSLLLLALLAACGGAESSDAAGGGTLVIAAAADADAMLPPLMRTTQGRLATELLFDRLVDIGPELNTVGDRGFVPKLAQRWRWSADSLTITFDLHPDAKWHDGQPVVAADVRAGLEAIRNPANGSSMQASLQTLDSLSTPDARTVVLHFGRRSAEQFYSAALIFPMPAHLMPSGSDLLVTSQLAREPVGNGPYRFVSWTPEERFELAANDDYYGGRPKLDRIVAVTYTEPATGLARIWAGEADVWELLPAGDLQEATRHPHVRLVDSYAFDYGFIAFNFRDARNRDRPHPLFADAAMRRAIAMGVDRDAVVRAIFDTLAYTLKGPFVRAQFTADTTISQIPVDRARAGALLDSLGWRVDARDGIRRRNGQRLTFTALIPGSSRNRERAAVLVQEQLRQLGVAMEIERAENQTFTQKRVAGTFDVVFSAWLTTPSPSGLRSTWGSFGEEGWGTLNDGRYSNPAVDAAIEAGLNTLDTDEARRQFRTAYQTIVDDVAALFLYEPRTVAAVHRRFIIPAWRPDGWWRAIPQWSVDPTQRLPRDARPAAN